MAMAIIRERQPIEASFSTFSPREYLREYYSRIGPENLALLNFFARAYRDVPQDAVMLEFGGGPTIYSLITAAGRVREIHFSDYLDPNLREVQSWREKSRGAFNWGPYFHEALRLENEGDVSSHDAQVRKEVLRQKLTKFLHCDAFQEDPLGDDYREAYDVVSVNFVPESITDSKETWEQLMANIGSVLKKNGTLIMSALRNASYYVIGNRAFPAVPITEEHLLEVLSKLGFQEINPVYAVPAEVTGDASEGYTGYGGFIFIKAKKQQKELPSLRDA